MSFWYLETEDLAFDDVHVVPQFSDIRSRKEVDLSAALAKTDFKLGCPIFASPMDTISGNEMASAIWNTVGGMAILHRYNAVEQQVKMAKEVAASGAKFGAAVGVGGDFLERAAELGAAGASVICVDVAHGHSVMMKEALTALRERFPKLHLMAGNVATVKGFNDLSDWGADSVRVGVGSGSICSTRVQTGHGIPLLQSLINITQKTKRTAQIIADGGLTSYGDAVKALAAGAHFVMTGRLLAGTDETPGSVFIQGEFSGLKYKTYRGMASKESQIEWRGFSSSNEGVSTTIPYRGPVKEILNDFTNALRSGLSYSGTRTLEEFRTKAVLTKVSRASQVEATPHILTR